MQVTRAVADAVGPERTAIRLSPYTTFLDAIDDDPVALGSYMAEQLNPLSLAYLHMVEPRVPSGAQEGDFDPDATLAPFRKIYNGMLGHLIVHGQAFLRIAPVTLSHRKLCVLLACFSLRAVVRRRRHPAAWRRTRQSCNTGLHMFVPPAHYYSPCKTELL